MNAVFEVAGEVVMEPLWPPVPIPNVPAWTNRVPWTIIALTLFMTPSIIWVAVAAEAIANEECVRACVRALVHVSARHRPLPLMAYCSLQRQCKRATRSKNRALDERTPM
jgi:hypothetical protein